MLPFAERPTVEEVLKALRASITRLGAERVVVATADGRVAAEDVEASVAVPHFRRAAMDGWAVIAASTAKAAADAPVRLAVVDGTGVGRTSERRLGVGEAAAIATGAPLPVGADAVIRAERATWAPDADALELHAPVERGKDVGQIGEDIEAGSIVLHRGRALRPADLGVLSSVGVRELSVVCRPEVHLVITGDEILRAGEAPSGTSIPDANGPMLAALARRDGARVVDTVYAPDRRERIDEAIREASRGDVVLISGGSSVGAEDHAAAAVAAAGRLHVHGVRLRPASPAGFGELAPRADGRAALAFVLPGNPVSALAAYEFFAGPAIRAIGGRSMEWPHPIRRARLATSIESELGRTDYVRVTFAADGAVVPIATRGASILSSATRADGVVVVEAKTPRLPAGHDVDVRLYA